MANKKLAYFTADWKLNLLTMQLKYDLDSRYDSGDLNLSILMRLVS